MTDLERHWDDLPVGGAPVDAILREARREAALGAQRRPAARLKRSLGRVAVLGGVAAAFVAGTLVTQSGSPVGVTPTPPGSPGAPGAPDVTPAAFHGELQAPASCDELLQHYVAEGLDLVTRYGWGGPASYDRRLPDFDDGLRDFAVPFDAPMVAEADLATTGGLAGTVRSDSTDSGTNVQEAGVDEPDSVKTDGRLLVRLRGAELTVYDVTGDEVERLGSLDLGDFEDGEILLVGSTVVALGNDGTRPAVDDTSRYYSYYDDTSPQTRVLTIDIADPASPILARTVDYDASLVAARLHGTDVRLVLSKGLPDLDFALGEGKLQENRAVVEESTIDDWLPHQVVDGGEPTDLLACDRVAIPRAEIGLGTMAVVGFAADAADGAVESLGLAGDAPMTYESPDHLYLASSGGSAPFCFDFCDFSRTTGSGFDGTTHVYDFALDGTGASYVGAGEVEGTVRDRWSMDESGGVLRLAVGPSTETGNYNSIVTLRAEGDELVEVGRLDGLGEGEEIKSVRWFDGLALLVTFRQVDPLYAVDLTDVEDPTLLGELKIPGFSSYLHPLGTMRVVGVGSAGNGFRAQAGLFDVTDLTNPRRLDVVEYENGTYAKAAEDPRQFTWLPGRRIVLTVIARRGAGYVSRIQLDRGTMSNEMTKVEYGRDVDAVRLVPVAGAAGLERVVLVTGEDVEFFDLNGG